MQDAHSLYIETAAELGLVGVACLLTLLAGHRARARSAYLREPALIAGRIAALAVFAVHAGLDWDWEMPAVAGVAIVLAGMLLARADAAAATGPAASIHGACGISSPMARVSRGSCSAGSVCVREKAPGRTHALPRGERQASQTGTSGCSYTAARARRDARTGAEPPRRRT